MSVADRIMAMHVRNRLLEAQVAALAGTVEIQAAQIRALRAWPPTDKLEIWQKSGCPCGSCGPYQLKIESITPYGCGAQVVVEAP